MEKVKKNTYTTFIELLSFLQTAKLYPSIKYWQSKDLKTKISILI